MSRLGRGQPQSTGYIASGIGEPLVITAGGTITPSGAVKRGPNRLLAGSITPTGNPAKSVGQRTLTGSVTPASGAMRWAVGKRIVGTLTSAATLSWAVGKRLVGSSVPSAGLGNVTIPGSHLQTQSVAGGITPSGALKRGPSVSMAGSITPTAGALKWTASPRFAGGVVPIGVLLRKPGKPFAGTVASSGAVSNKRVTLAILAGTIASAGELTKRVYVSFFGGGQEAFQDDAFQTNAFVAGDNGMLSGSLTLRPGLLSLSLNSTIALSSTLTRNVAHRLTGLITPSAVATNIRVVLLRIAAQLDSSGELESHNVEAHVTRGKPGHTGGHTGKPGRIRNFLNKPGHTRK